MLILANCLPRPFRTTSSTVQVWVWDATTSKTLLLYTFTSPSPNVDKTWSPNEKYLAFTTTRVLGQTTSAAQLWVWDATTGKTLLLYTGPNASVDIYYSHWSSNEKYLAFTSYLGQGDTTTVQLWVWDATSGKTLLLYSFTGPNFSGNAPFVGAYWSSNEKYLAFTHTSTNPVQVLSTTTAQVWVWDATSGKTLLLYSFTGPNFSGHAPFMGSIFSAGGIVWSPTDGKHLTFFANSTDPSCQTISNPCAFDGTVRIWDDTTKGSIYVLPLGPSAVTTMAVSPDGTRIATGSADGTVYVLYVV